MPELPEIETLRKELKPALEGKKILKVVAYRPGMRFAFSSELLSLKGIVIEKVERRAKYFQLMTSKGTIMVHLGMSGQLRLLEGNPPREKHDHLDIEIEGGWRLRVRDPRRFGYVVFVENGNEDPYTSRMGPEPLSDEFSAQYLASRLKGKKSAIKSLIMDQGVVVGVGNIYAQEALHHARIRPNRQAGSLSAVEISSLVDAIKRSIRKGIELGGSSMRDYVHADGSKGGFLSQAHVYGREGQTCLSCSGPLEAERVGGRGTVFCPVCQR